MNFSNSTPNKPPEAISPANGGLPYEPRDWAPCPHTLVKFIEWGEEVRPGQYREAIGVCVQCDAEMVRGGTPDGFDDDGKLEWALDEFSNWERVA